MDDATQHELNEVSGALINILRRVLGIRQWKLFASVAVIQVDGINFYCVPGYHMNKSVVAVCSHTLIVAMKTIVHDTQWNRRLSPHAVREADCALSLAGVIRTEFHAEFLSSQIIPENTL